MISTETVDRVALTGPFVVEQPLAEPAGVGPRRRSRFYRVGVHLGALALFTLPAVFLWWNAWSGGAASTVRCSCLDPGQQVWFVAWPAYALSHGLSPFSTTWLWPGHGVNLLNNTSAPLVGLTLSPITWLFGPLVSTTLALTLTPGLSAWGCWVACRRLVSWGPACWAAGFLFGYSPFVVESVAQGHVSTGLLVVPPLILVVLHEILVRQRRSPTWCGVALGGLLFAQFLISAEILTITALVAAGGVAAAAALSPRRALRASPFALRAFGVGAAVAFVLLAGPVWYTVAGPQHIKGSVWSSLHDIFVAQAWELWSAGPAKSPLFPGALQGPQLQFLGFGVITLAGASVVIAWRRRTMWVMAIVAVATTVLSWGGILFLSPDHLVVSRWLPWGWFTNRAIVDDINAIHFSAFTDLAVAIVVAFGLDTLHRSPAWHRLPSGGRGVAVASVVALLVLPVWALYQAPLSVQPVRVPAWYSTAALRVPEGSVVTSYPFPASGSATSQPMVWQSVDGMRFRLAGGYVKVPSAGRGAIAVGPPGSATWTLDELTLAPASSAGSFPLTPQQLGALRSSVRSWGTSYIVVADTGSVPIEAAAVFTAATGLLPSVSHRAWVWDLGAGALRGAYDAGAQATAFTECRSQAPDLGEVPGGRPLPQVLNRCIATAARTAGPQ